jgi:hypothetical protein
LPLRAGWRCTQCTHRYHALIHRLATTLLEHHQQRNWLVLAEHTAWDQCIFCEVLTPATEIVLADQATGAASP